MIDMRPALTALDRCDRCGAPAHAVTNHDSGELMWCAHHYREHQDALAPALIFMTSSLSKSKEPAPA